MLREYSTVRTTGFQDAIDALGTHVVCGHNVPYSDVHIRAVLQGKRHASPVLLERIAVRSPGLFGLRYVCQELKDWYARWQEEQAKANERKTTERRGIKTA